MVAEPFTKALPPDKFQYFLKLMGIDWLQYFLKGSCSVFIYYNMKRNNYV